MPDANTWPYPTFKTATGEYEKCYMVTEWFLGRAVKVEYFWRYKVNG